MASPRRKSAFPVCIMNAGYSSGWCEESFGITLVAAEIECKAMGDEHDRFIMAPPAKIEALIKNYADRKPSRVMPSYEIPGFFSRKIQEEELRTKNIELERLNKFMVNREIKMAELKKENEELKKISH